MDKIFRWFTLADDSISVIRITWFASRFEADEFEGVDKLLALFLGYCANLGIVAKRSFLEAYLKTEGKKVIKKENIKLQTMENFDYSEPASLEEAYRIMCTSVLNTYDAYVGIDLTDHSFKVDMSTFMSEQKINRVQTTMATAFPLLTSGGDPDNIIEDMQFNLDKISCTYDTDYLQKLDFMSGKVETTHKSNKMRFLFKTGIPCIDGDIGGMFSKQVWAFSSQPGAGKTRFAAVHVAYQAAVVYHLDVIFDELELTKMEVENMLIAHHVINLYRGKVKIPDSLVNKDQLTEEQSRYVEAARIDLFETEDKYGRIVIREDELVVEKMEKEMYTYLKHNRNTQVWVIDYSGLIKSKPIGKYERRLDGYEIVATAYKIAKEIAKIADIGVFFLNQFAKEGIQAAYAGKKIIPGHIQAGQIIERHSDYDIAMCMTEEQEIANMRTMSTVKKRAASGFQNVPFNVDLSVSIFRQIHQDMLNSKK